MTAAGLIEFDLVIRSAVQIEASPEVVWARLDRIAEWKASVVSVERVEGAHGAVGEVVRIGQRPADETVYVFMKTLRLKYNAWKVQSLATEDGRTINGYVIYSLCAHEVHTQVVCDVIARCLLAKDAARGRSVDQVAREGNEGTLAKLDADHRALKRLVEGA